MSNTPHHETIFRAGPPQILFVPDVAIVLQCSHSTARRLIRDGYCGPQMRIGRRIAVLRASMMTALQTRGGFGPIS